MYDLSCGKTKTNVNNKCGILPGLFYKKAINWN
jgi:hypothetical protein